MEDAFQASFLTGKTESVGLSRSSIVEQDLKNEKNLAKDEIKKTNDRLKAELLRINAEQAVSAKRAELLPSDDNTLNNNRLPQTYLLNARKNTFAKSMFAEDAQGSAQKPYCTANDRISDLAKTQDDLIQNDWNKATKADFTNEKLNTAQNNAMGTELRNAPSNSPAKQQFIATKLIQEKEKQNSLDAFAAKNKKIDEMIASLQKLIHETYPSSIDGKNSNNSISQIGEQESKSFQIIINL